jgi:hypothetical protein
VHVARVSLVPDGRDTDLSLVHVILREAGGVEHGLGGTLGLGLGDVGGDLVELIIGGAEGSSGEETAVGEELLALIDIVQLLAMNPC